MNHVTNGPRTIEDLPEEILLRIFRHIQPYQDYCSIRLVCQQWARLWRVIKTWRYETFHNQICLSNKAISIHWQLVDPPTRLNLVPRYCHSVCYVDSTHMLYVFGGRRDLVTSLNDFWRFNLSTRIWERILATGRYPPPKCSSTLIHDENGNLILFGGRSMIYIDDIHMREQYHGELHSYSIQRNCWNLHVSLNEPGPICDQSASLIHRNNQNLIVIFGGSIMNADSMQPNLAQETNNLWEWNNVWTLVTVDGLKPEPRRGHSQFTINTETILIVGGSSQNRACRDVWLFSFSTLQWTQIPITNQYPNEFAPSNEDFSCLPFCLVASKTILLTFGRLKRNPTEHERRIYSEYDYSNCEPILRSQNSVMPSSSSDENDEINRRSFAHRRIPLSTENRRYNLMDISSGFQLYRLDLSNLFAADPHVTWLPSKCTSVFGSPTRVSLYYSLICARSELVLFGGVEKRKLQWDRVRTSNDSSAANRSRLIDGTLALVTISNIPL